MEPAMDPSTRNYLIGAGSILAAAALWYFTTHISTADALRYGEQCKKWISKEFEEGGETLVGGHWKKKGKMVFEILAPKVGTNSSSLYLCVVDKSKGTMLKPSAFDASWR